MADHMASGSPVQLGDFRILAPLGVGGMGEVWRAVHLQQGVRAAVKVITAAHAHETEYRQTFAREVQAVAALDHPGVLTVFDFGVVSEEAAQASAGRLVAGCPWLAMELADGGSLAELRGQMTWPVLRRILLAILDALAHAHARLLVHRDLKPENLLRLSTPEGFRVKVTDFGIAHAMRPEIDGAMLEVFAVRAGTPAYMPPEQLQGRWRDYGPWTDLYALGCVTFELVSGKPPFVSTSLQSLAAAHLYEQPPHFLPRFPVPIGLNDWVQRLLQKRPTARFMCAADAAQALMALPDGGDGVMAAAVPSVRSPSGVHTQPTVAAGQLGRAQATVLEGRRTLPERVPSLDMGEMSTATLIENPVPSESLPLAPPVEAATLVATAVMTRDFPPAAWQDPPLLAGATRHPLGLGLFGLRPVPFVARQTERAALWEALGQVIAQKRVGVVLLSGEAGCGKSRLAEWLSQRAGELGLAQALRATHSPIPGLSDGLAWAVANAFGAAMLPREAIFKRAQEHLRSVGGDPDTIDGDAAALTAAIAPPPGPAAATATPTPTVRFSSDRERHQAVVRFLHRTSQQRATVFWLDDVHWGSDALTFVRTLMDSPLASSMPVLILATLRDQAMAEGSIEAALVENLRMHARVTELVLARLAPAEEAELIARTLPLEASLGATVQSRAQGLPLHTIQILATLIHRGVLRAQGAGYVLDSPTAFVLPDDIRAIWWERVHDTLSAFPNGLEALLPPLELAAALGLQVDGAEWEALCQQAGWPAPRTLTNRHDETLLDALLRQGIAQLYGLTESNAERCALHWLAAQAHAETVAPLFAAVTHNYDIGNYSRAAVLLDHLAHSLSHLPSQAHQHDDVALRSWRCSLHLAQGDYLEARTIATELIANLPSDGWSQARFRALKTLAQCYREEGELERARGMLQEALAAARHAGEVPSALSALKNLATIDNRQGHVEEACRKLAEAQNEALEHGLPQEAMALRLVWASALLSSGELGQARAHAAAALDFFHHLGARHNVAEALNLLAEIDRLEGSLEAAEARYREAGLLWEAIGSDAVWLTRINLALILIQRQRFALAQADLERLREYFEFTERFLLQVFVESALAAAFAGQGNAQRFDEHLATTTILLERSGTVDVDLATLLEFAGEAWDTQGDHTRAAQAFALALAQWRTLGQEQRAAPLATRLHPP